MKQRRRAAWLALAICLGMAGCSGAAYQASLADQSSTPQVQRGSDSGGSGGGM